MNFRQAFLALIILGPMFSNDPAAAQSSKLVAGICPPGCTCKNGHVNCFHARLDTDKNRVAVNKEITREEIPDLIVDLQKLQNIK